MPTLRLKLILGNLAPFLLFYVAYYVDHDLKEADLYPIFLIPIFWISSKWGWPTGCLFSILGAMLSTPASPLLEFSNNYVYLNVFITRSITLVLLCMFYSNYISMLNSHKKRYDRLTSLVNQCPDCGALLCHDGQWRTIRELNSNPSSIGTIPKHDNCPNQERQKNHNCSPK